MLIVSQNGLNVYNFNSAARISFDLTVAGIFGLLIYFPAYDRDIDEPIQFRVAEFKDGLNYQKCIDNLVAAYVNGEKVFRVPKEEELTDDDG